MSNARHSAKNPDWCSPTDLIEMIRTCHGGRIDFDPFTSYTAQKTVKAERFFTPDQDAFTQDWVCSAGVINPPGLQVATAWRKLSKEILLGNTTAMIWVGFSVEQLCVLADPNEPDEPDEVRWARGGFHPLDFTGIILRKRISFVREDGTSGSPSHGNYLVAPGVPAKRFVEVFGSMGRAWHGHLSIS